MWQGLEFVITEDKRYGVYVILSFGNNFDEYGGRELYVQWAREHGQTISSDGDFYTNSVVSKDIIRIISIIKV